MLYATGLDVNILHFVADGASNLEFRSILEVLPEPATVAVAACRDEVVSVDDHS